MHFLHKMTTCGTATILSIKKGKVQVILLQGKTAVSAESYWCCVTIFGGTRFEGALGEINVGPGAERETERALLLVWAVSRWCPPAYLHSLSGQITSIACEQGSSSSSH